MLSSSQSHAAVTNYCRNGETAAVRVRVITTSALSALIASN